MTICYTTLKTLHECPYFCGSHHSALPEVLEKLYNMRVSDFKAQHFRSLPMRNIGLINILVVLIAQLIWEKGTKSIKHSYNFPFGFDSTGCITKACQQFAVTEHSSKTCILLPCYNFMDGWVYSFLTMTDLNFSLFYRYTKKGLQDKIIT